MQQPDEINRRLNAIRVYLLEDLEQIHCDVLLTLVENYGLMHEAVPKTGTTAREILQRAKVAGVKAAQRIVHAFARTASWVALKIRWGAARDVASERIRSQTYQTMRGSCAISRYPDPEDRKDLRIGRRPNREVTEFLQIGGRYLEAKCDVESPDYREEWLAGILLRAEGNQSPSKRMLEQMKARVHMRLIEAPPLDEFNYRFAVGEKLSDEWQPISMQIRVRMGEGSMAGETPVSSQDLDEAVRRALFPDEPNKSS